MNTYLWREVNDEGLWDIKQIGIWTQDINEGVGEEKWKGGPRRVSFLSHFVQNISSAKPWRLLETRHNYVWKKS